MSATGRIQLQAEWQLLYQLAARVDWERRAEELAEGFRDEIRRLKDEVASLRKRSPWSELLKQFVLNDNDMDILACVVAPEAEPRIGQRFQTLSQGPHFPTTALIAELYCMDGEQLDNLEMRLMPDAPLARHHLIMRSPESKFEPVEPTPILLERLLGRRKRQNSIRGAVEVLPHPIFKGNSAKRKPFEALVLPPYCRRQLKELMLWASRRDTIEKWGAYVLGGPVALFCGPSGTGKTFAAEALAFELGKPLFRVDLGNLVSKYIGETEKNMNRLFDSAQDADVVLLFDEADSLFGKRGEVKEARDRYANMEVSHLLSRIERHKGVCVLTSNLRRNIDPAFLRRFQVVISFPRPDEQARAQLWERCLPPKAPGRGKIDTELIAREVELTGGQIRNAALHASVIAAGNSGKLTNETIALGILNELRKEPRPGLLACLGKFRAYLPEEVC